MNQTAPRNRLRGRRVLLGVTGGIAAYKAAELLRRLGDAGAEVRVAMTAGARAFVQPLTFQALSGKPVHCDLLDPAAEAAMGHIELARWADAVLVAPATADFIARLAHGFADDLLATLCLASDAPIAVAPAMNRLMWSNPATQDNVATLARRGVAVYGPGSGGQACGEVGAGRMLEADELVALLADDLFGGPKPLDGQRVLITAGPTREAIDPVRFISNHSSGKMGFAVADAALRAGAEVTLVAGPVQLATPPGVERIDVESALDMYDAVIERAAAASVFVAVAAVADFRSAGVAGHKIKKTDDQQQMALELVRNPDILASVASLPDGPFSVGFAAETRDVEHYARAKLAAKQLDMIAANHVGGETGFNSADNALDVYWGDAGHRHLPRAQKAEIARQLVALIGERMVDGRDRGAAPLAPPTPAADETD